MIDYKVVVVTTNSGRELEQACNDMAARGYVLIAAYPETVISTCCCSSQEHRAVFLIFAHP